VEWKRGVLRYGLCNEPDGQDTASRPQARRPYTGSIVTSLEPESCHLFKIKNLIFLFFYLALQFPVPTVPFPIKSSYSANSKPAQATATELYPSNTDAPYTSNSNYAGPKTNLAFFQLCRLQFQPFLSLFKPYLSLFDFSCIYKFTLYLINFKYHLSKIQTIPFHIQIFLFIASFGYMNGKRYLSQFKSYLTRSYRSNLTKSNLTLYQASPEFHETLLSYD